MAMGTIPPLLNIDCLGRRPFTRPAGTDQHTPKACGRFASLRHRPVAVQGESRDAGVAVDTADLEEADIRQPGELAAQPANADAVLFCNTDQKPHGVRAQGRGSEPLFLGQAIMFTLQLLALLFLALSFVRRVHGSGEGCLGVHQAESGGPNFISAQGSAAGTFDGGHTWTGSITAGSKSEKKS
jgi:hypothetical protein